MIDATLFQSVTVLTFTSTKEALHYSACPLQDDPNILHSTIACADQALMEVGQSIEDDRRALEAEGAVKIRKIEVDFEHFEVCDYLEIPWSGMSTGYGDDNDLHQTMQSSHSVHNF